MVFIYDIPSSASPIYASLSFSLCAHTHTQRSINPVFDQSSSTPILPNFGIPMATEHYMEETKESSLQKLKLDQTEPEINRTGGFDCNICLDLVNEPVVTLCGHLYCWPCIYKWIQFQSDPVHNPDTPNPQCPVCKNQVSKETLVPLYGRGQTKSSKNLGLVIPHRPSSPRALQGANYRVEARSRLGYESPVVGMIGEMVYARIFGNSETTLYAYPNTYYFAGINSPRVRRHVLEADESLSRVCFFLCCGIILCWLLF